MKVHAILFLITMLLAGAGRSIAQSTLTLEAFLRQVEVNNPALRSADFEPEIAEAEVRAALGRFDPVLNLSYEYKDKDGKDKLNLFDGALELPLDMLFGPKLKASYSRGMGSSINPESATTGQGEGALGISMPILQGIFTDSRRNQLRKAMLRPDLAQAQYRLERNNLLRTAGLRYWDWSEARAAVDVADTMLALAERRLVFVTRRAQAGESAVIDSVEIAQEVERRKGERFRALRIEEQLAVDVAVFLWNGNGTPQQTVGARPLDLPPQADTTVQAIDAANLARSTRPELRRAEVFQQTSRLDSSLAQEFMRPYIEVEAALLAYDVTSLSNTDYKLGVRVNQPLLFRQASAQQQTAGITVQRADLTRSLIERMVDADAINAVISIDRSRERL
ncbi:MAG TPA: TolC family protein, partial [Candidatus Didemnitutus sp.]|nr:TolC family protein [Candidatus Didemnitutus sp.]